MLVEATYQSFLPNSIEVGVLCIGNNLYVLIKISEKVVDLKYGSGWCGWCLDVGRVSNGVSLLKHIWHGDYLIF